MQHVLFLLILFITASPAAAATYYVAKTSSSDSYTCTQAQTVTTAKLTIAGGLGCLTAPGDILIIKAGTYAEAIGNAQVPSGTSWSVPVTIAAAAGETVTLNPTGTTRNITFQSGTAKQYVIIDGLILDGINLQTTFSDGVLIAYPHHHIRLQNVEIKNSWRNGVLVVSDGSGPSDNNEFLNLTIHDVSLGCAGIGGCYPFYIESNSNLIDGAEVYAYPAYGIHIYNSVSPFPSNNIVRNSIIRNGTGAQRSSASALLLASGDGNIAVNNIIANNNFYGVRIGLEASNSKFYNNTVYGSLYWGIGIAESGGATNTDVRNNIFYQNALGSIYNNGTGSTFGTNMCGATGTGCLSSPVGNPLFVNAATNDFHLQASSPAINQGATLSQATPDIAGVSRPQSTAYDIGAYEYVAPDTTPPTVTGRTPASGATGVVTTTTVTATFSEAMNAATITTSTVELRNPSSALIPAAVSYNAGTNTATLTPSSALANATTYTASIISGGSGVKDVVGNALVSNSTWSFTTIAAVGGAPLRPGQPYAEAAKCAAPGVILCEDFNYPANFTCGADVGGGGQEYAWNNPGWAVVPTGSACAGKSLVTQASVPTQPAGSPSGGYVKRVDPDDGEGQDVGCLWGDCDRATDDSPTGQTYANGLPLSNDLYFRFQIYFSSDYKWPDFDNKIFFMWPNRYVDKPSANIDAGMIFGNGVFCPTFNENFNDALSFRVGSNAGNFKIYPADANTDGYAEHPEYCLGNGYGNNSPDISRVDPPNDTPYPGTVFRFQKAKWYTIEFRYKLGSEGVENGIIEAWVNGTKVYSDSDLETCGDGLGNCAAVQEIVQYFWYNAFQEGGDLAGYGLFDNLIISTAYIGPPSAATPSAPSGLRGGVLGVGGGNFR